MLTIRVKGLEELQESTGELGKWARGPFRGRAAEKIRDDFLGEVATSFKSRGRSTGRSWAPLSPTYKAWKDSAYPGRPLLVLTGRLRESLTNARSRDSVYNRRQNGCKLVSLGTRGPYAGYHQHGTSKMPRRPVVVVKSKIGKRWAEYLSADVEAAWKGKRWQAR